MPFLARVIHQRFLSPRRCTMGLENATTNGARERTDRRRCCPDVSARGDVFWIYVDASRSKVQSWESRAALGFVESQFVTVVEHPLWRLFSEESAFRQSRDCCLADMKGAQQNSNYFCFCLFRLRWCYYYCCHDCYVRSVLSSLMRTWKYNGEQFVNR